MTMSTSAEAVEATLNNKGDKCTAVGEDDGGRSRRTIPRTDSRGVLMRCRSLDWEGNHVVIFEDGENDGGGVGVRHGNAGGCGEEEKPELMTVSTMSDSPWYRRLNLISTPPTLPQVQSWDFDALVYSPAALVPAISVMFEHYDLLSTFSVDPETFAGFVTAVMDRYNTHEYHNWCHGVSCTHVSFLLLSLDDGDLYLTKADIFAVLFGALIHDVDHPGHNNDFEVKSGSDRAKKYGNDAVLENYSLDVTLEEILALPGCDVFAPMEGEDREYIRRMIRDVVVWTDPARHGDLLKAMVKLAEEVPELPADDGAAVSGGERGGGETDSSDSTDSSLAPPPCFWNKDDLASRTLLCRMIVHAGDISNPVHNSNAVVRDWCHRISAEFSHQVEMERELGLQVSTFMDGLDDEYRVAKMQTGFYKFMAMPFFMVVGMLLPKAVHLVQSGNENLRKYQEIVDYVDRNVGG